MNMNYGDVGYRRRYGARAQYYHQFGYAGPPWGVAPPQAPTGGGGGVVHFDTAGGRDTMRWMGRFAQPGQAIQSSDYGIWPFTQKAGTEEQKAGTKITNTILDTLAIIGSTVVAGPVGFATAGSLVAMRRAAAAKREAAGGLQVTAGSGVIPGAPRLKYTGVVPLPPAVEAAIYRTVPQAYPTGYPDSYQVGGAVTYPDAVAVGETTDSAGINPLVWIAAGTAVAGAVVFAMTRKKKRR